MHRCLGAPRDPFEETRDPALAWEPASRARVRDLAEAALRQGRGVWVRGPGGAGRGWLLARLADELSLEGRRVLFWEGAVPDTDAGLLEALLRVADPLDEAGDLLDLAGALYRRLLEAFVTAGPTVVVPATTFPIPPRALEELRLLADLRVAGRPLAVLALAGDGPSPIEGLTEVALPAPSVEELREFLCRRAAACDCPDLLADEELEHVARRAGGFREVLELARRAVARRAFGAPDASARGGARAEDGAPILDPDDLGEVGRLLTDLEPDPAAPESF